MVDERVCRPNDSDHPVAPSSSNVSNSPKGDSGASDCSAIFERAIKAGYSNEVAKQFVNDVVKERATNNTVDFLLRRPDLFGPGVVKKIQSKLNSFINDPNFVGSHQSKVAILPSLSPNV